MAVSLFDDLCDNARDLFRLVYGARLSNMIEGVSSGEASKD